MTIETVGIVIISILLIVLGAVVLYIIIKNAIRYRNLYKSYGEGQVSPPEYDATTLKPYRVLALPGQPQSEEFVLRSDGDQDVIIGMAPMMMYDRGNTEHSYGSKPDETDPVLRTYDNDKAPYPATNPHSMVQLHRIRNGLPLLIFPTPDG